MADLIKVYRKDLEGFYEVSEDRAKELEAVGYSRDPQISASTSASVTYDRQEGLQKAQSLYSFFNQDLLNEYANNWVNTGDATRSIGMLRQSAVWEKEFGYLKRDDGSLIMSELDAVSNIASYKNTLFEYNIKDFTLFEDKFKDLISTEVSPLEFQQRIDLVYNQVIDDIPKVKELFARDYGIEATDDAIFGALINEDVEQGLLSNQITTLQIEAEAAAAGFNTSFARFETLRREGLTREKARTLYRNAQGLIDAASTVGRELDLSTLEGAALGDVQATKRLQRTQADIFAQQGATLGAAKKGDEVTGLIAG
ncbi:hypothetical protein N8814_05235 [Acidimicrobiia bacterium]|nr:hypothetical protein [Acidimicrobiia bacterium]